MAFCSGEKLQNWFSTWWLWRPSWITNWNDLSYFWSTGHPDTSYKASSIGLSVQEKKFKLDFQDGDCGRDLGFLIRIILAILIYKSLQYFLSSFKSVGILVQEKKFKIDFQAGGYLAFPIRMILTIFDLQVNWIRSTKFRVNWPFRSGGEVQTRFSRWRPWQPSWISDSKILANWSASHPDTFYQVSSQLAFWFRSSKYIKWQPPWISDRNNFSYFWSASHPDTS